MYKNIEMNVNVARCCTCSFFGSSVCCSFINLWLVVGSGLQFNFPEIEKFELSHCDIT